MAWAGGHDKGGSRWVQEARGGRLHSNCASCAAVRVEAVRRSRASGSLFGASGGGGGWGL
jgi:hypothetical protein